MPALLFGMGAFALFAGLVMVGFGIPINEFSFGNTLISSGTTAAVGGLIIIGLGIVVGQLRRVAEALTLQLQARPGQPAAKAFENASAPRSIPSQGHVPFPARFGPEPHKGETGAVPPAPAAMPIEDKPAESFVPTLRNPDQSQVTFEDEISLSPHHSLAPAVQPDADRSRDPGWRSPAPPAPPGAAPPARPLHNSNFDAMWPAEERFSKSPAAGESEPDARPGVPLRGSPAPPPKRVEPEKPRAAAILKSGVVDGMGYTLYVDGSIEAELPQGTLRFASINELRSHLAKNS
jgi:hypothetical protein